MSGPWSLDWLKDLNQRDVGVIFTASKRLKKGGQPVLTKNVRRRRCGKGNSDLCHRPSSEESTSSASVNNDWKHWVVMQGDDKAAEDDVRGFGKALGWQNPWSLMGSDRLSDRLFSDHCSDRFQRPKLGTESATVVCDTPFDATATDLETSLRDRFCDLSGINFLGSGWVREEEGGSFIKSGEEFYVANVYAPCDSRAKLRLWDSLSFRIQSLGRQKVCICGDFNAVKSDNTMVDLPLSGRKFTWFKGDGLSMSRLDRFQLSEDWCLTWPNCKQEARMRGVSDHCPLILSANEDDWGPRPSRMLKC
ncbi:hypothetical protein TSUD_299350 [Trifolium subterraneum]|nr:hypothetical protein TSUD_299350 [Trifolium subterraneum]